MDGMELMREPLPFWLGLLLLFFGSALPGLYWGLLIWMMGREIERERKEATTRLKSILDKGRSSTG